MPFHLYLNGRAFMCLAHLDEFDIWLRLLVAQGIWTDDVIEVKLVVACPGCIGAVHRFSRPRAGELR